MSHTRRKYIRNGIPYRSSRLQDGKLVYLYIIKLLENILLDIKIFYPKPCSDTES